MKSEGYVAVCGEIKYLLFSHLKVRVNSSKDPLRLAQSKGWTTERPASWIQISSGEMLTLIGRRENLDWAESAKGAASQSTVLGTLHLCWNPVGLGGGGGILLVDQIVAELTES